jgi:small subunit ribosomal protein S17
MTDTTIHQRTFTGTVISDKMDKTRVVAVSRSKKHSKYLKFFKVTTTFMAHDENNTTKAGDVVTIRAMRPMSKLKRWEIVTPTN